jgi:molybdate transport system substrate-binding protein
MDSIQFKRFLRLLPVYATFCTGSAAAAELTVSAASSLSNAFTEIAHAFEAKHPGDKVTLNLAASDVLLRQIEQGAPADVFASADETTMDRGVERKLVDAASRRDFARNTLVVIVAHGAKAPSALSQLARQNNYEHIAIGNPDSVPAGSYAKQALIDAGLWDALQGQIVPTQNVRQALDYVARGDAQAGFVYATDAAIQKEKVSVALTVPTSSPVRYPIAIVANSAHAALARSFVEFVASAEGQALLRQYGFSGVAT